MIVYKVVYKHPYLETFTSVFAGGVLRMTYTLGKETKLPDKLRELDCGLMCFATMDQAKEWILTVASSLVWLERIYIFKCEASKRDLIGLPRGNCMAAYTNAEYALAQKMRGPCRLPAGTLGLSRVRPVKAYRVSFKGGPLYRQELEVTECYDISM